MEVGFSLTVGWQMLSFIVVFGVLAGIGYLIWDAHKESHELAELEMRRGETNRTRNPHILIFKSYAKTI
jgi:hypothetical protein